MKSPSFANEDAFRVALASYLEALGHEAWAHEGAWPKRFTIHGLRKSGIGFVDLYVRPSMIVNRQGVIITDRFPVIAVETKLAKEFGWLIEAILQVSRYRLATSSTDAYVHRLMQERCPVCGQVLAEDHTPTPRAEYRINGKLVEPPSIVLLATDALMDYGTLLNWDMPPWAGERRMSQEAAALRRQHGNMYLTELFDRILWKHRAALLRHWAGRTFFITNALDGTTQWCHLDAQNQLSWAAFRRNVPAQAA